MSGAGAEAATAGGGVPDVPEVFQLGCVVSIESPFNERFHGEVIAFDDAHKALILKCQNGDRGKTTDVRLVNMLYVSKLDIEREPEPNTPQPPAQVNIEKVRQRMRRHVDERKKMAAAIAKGVTLDGISVFLAIRKTIDEVTWQERDILVMNSVRVEAPYRPDNCVPLHGSADSQSVMHVRKIVEKHLKDFRKEDGRETKDE